MATERKRYWTDDRLREEAKKYDTRNGFRTGSPSAYNIAAQQKLLPELTARMPNNSGRRMKPKQPE